MATFSARSFTSSGGFTGSSACASASLASCECLIFFPLSTTSSIFWRMLFSSVCVQRSAARFISITSSLSFGAIACARGRRRGGGGSRRVVQMAEPQVAWREAQRAGTGAGGRSRRVYKSVCTGRVGRLSSHQVQRSRHPRSRRRLSSAHESGGKKGRRTKHTIARLAVQSNSSTPELSRSCLRSAQKSPVDSCARGRGATRARE